MLTGKQRALAFVAVSVLALCAFGYGIVEKEEIKANGQTVLLELTPVDPRSLMQGDYMTLAYKAAENLTPPPASGFADYSMPPKTTRGYAVFAPDTLNIARYLRIHDEAVPLKKSEFIVRYHIEYGRAQLKPDSFMFQEGLANTYQPARYGIFKADERGRILLVGLADENRKELAAETRIRTE